MYLKDTRKQRTDLLVCRLLNEVLIDLRKKVTQISLGLQSRRTNLAEGKQHDLCTAIPDEVALNLVCHSFSSENIDGPGDKTKEEVFVKSFSKEDINYNIYLNENGLIAKCSCPYMAFNHVACKHMFIASRILGYGIYYSTREMAISSRTEENTSAAVSELKGSAKQNQLQVQYDEALAIIEPFRNKLDELEDEDKNCMERAIDTLRGIGSTLKYSSSEPWTKRQRR